MAKQMTYGEAANTPGTKLYAARLAQRERNARVDAMTDSERRAYYADACKRSDESV